MKYLMPKFTCPASANTSQKRWDYAFLTDEEYRAKYGEGKRSGEDSK
jgi:hypothetical protein